MQSIKNQIAKITAITLMLIMPQLLRAADGSKDSQSMWNWFYDNIILVIGIVVLASAVVMLIGLMNTMTSYQQKEFLKEHGVEVPEVQHKSGSSLWSKINKMMWKLVPMEKEADIDLGHDYDGIRELDNSLPPWWLYMFYFTIAWAGVYMYVYHWSDIGMSQEEEYIASVKEAEEFQLELLAKQKNRIDENNVTAVNTPEALEAGKTIFIANCAVCHGQLGEGTVGPNLTDDYWTQGPGIKNIFKTIKYGVPEKGMIAWKTQLRPTSMQNLASYVLSLHGTDPPNQKDPEGDLHTETEE